MGYLVYARVTDSGKVVFNNLPGSSKTLENAYQELMAGLEAHPEIDRSTLPQFPVIRISDDGGKYKVDYIPLYSFSGEVQTFTTDKSTHSTGDHTASYPAIVDHSFSLLFDSAPHKEHHIATQTKGFTSPEQAQVWVAMHQMHLLSLYTEWGGVAAFGLAEIKGKEITFTVGSTKKTMNFGEKDTNGYPTLTSSDLDSPAGAGSSLGGGASASTASADLSGQTTLSDDVRAADVGVFAIVMRRIADIAKTADDSGIRLLNGEFGCASTASAALPLHTPTSGGASATILTNDATTAESAATEPTSGGASATPADALLPNDAAAATAADATTSPEDDLSCLGDCPTDCPE